MCILTVALQIFYLPEYIFLSGFSHCLHSMLISWSSVHFCNLHVLLVIFPFFFFFAKGSWFKDQIIF